MKFTIKHELKGRMRFHAAQKEMSCKEADTLSYYLQGITGVTSVKVYGRTADAVVNYNGDRELVLSALRNFRYENVDVPEGILEHSGRQLNDVYREKLIQKVVLRVGSKLFLPYPVRVV